MGKNLALNLADHGYRVAGFDLDKEKVQDVLDTEAKERPDTVDQARIIGCELDLRLEASHFSHIFRLMAEYVLSVASSKQDKNAAENTLDDFMPSSFSSNFYADVTDHVAPKSLSGTRSKRRSKRKLR